MTFARACGCLLAGLALALTTTGCAVSRETSAEYALAASYSGYPKLQANVHLVIDEFFATHVWVWGGTREVRDKHHVPVGAASARQAEVVARSAFTSVQVVREAPSSGLVLIPEISRMDRSSPGSEMTTAMQLRWEFRKDGAVVWTTEQTGIGRGGFGTPFSMMERLHEHVELAMDDAFRKSYEALMTSPEVAAAAGD